MIDHVSVAVRDLAASGLGRLKTDKVVPVQGKFPSPKSIAAKSLARLPILQVHGSLGHRSR